MHATRKIGRWRLVHDFFLGTASERPERLPTSLISTFRKTKQNQCKQKSLYQAQKYQNIIYVGMLRRYSRYTLHRKTRIMSTSSQSYASAAGSKPSLPIQPGQQLQHKGGQHGASPTTAQTKPPQHQARGPQAAVAAARRRYSPNTSTSSNHHHHHHHYTPQTTSSENSVYVLTLLTDPHHHETLTSLRTQYFPRHLNKLQAHLTLFHALPGSKLESAIIPTLEAVAAATASFPLAATEPFRLNKGIAISVPDGRGGQAAKDVHARLQRQWAAAGFLSRQDAAGFRAHYTIMNKVDDGEEVTRAFREVEGSWEGCGGRAEGLSLYLYERGYWKHVKDFRFTNGHGTGQ